MYCTVENACETCSQFDSLPLAHYLIRRQRSQLSTASSPAAPQPRRRRAAHCASSPSRASPSTKSLNALWSEGSTPPLSHSRFRTGSRGISCENASGGIAAQVGFFSFDSTPLITFCANSAHHLTRSLLPPPGTIIFRGTAVQRRRSTSTC